MASILPITRIMISPIILKYIGWRVARQYYLSEILFALLVLW